MEPYLTGPGMGETLGQYANTFKDSLGRWASWLAGRGAPAPAPVPPQIEMQGSFSQGINELPENEQPLLGGNEPEEEVDWGADEDLPGGLDEADLDLGMDLEEPLEWGSEAWLENLKVEEDALNRALGVGTDQTIELTELGTDAMESGTETLEIVIEGAEIAAEATEATAAGVIGGAALGALGAAAMIGATIGAQKLLGWLAKKKRVVKEKDDDPWMGLVGYFVVGKVWYPMIVDLVSHNGKIVTLEWKDLTKFRRWTSVKKDDERIRLLYPPVRFKLPKYPKVVLESGKTIRFPYYVKYPVNTFVKMKTNGMKGKIVRGMIFDHEPSNPDGTYDQYKIRLDNSQLIYALVSQFDVFRQGPKHGAKGKLGRLVPGRTKPKGLRKAKVRGILTSEGRIAYYAMMAKKKHQEEIDKKKDTTGARKKDRVCSKSQGKAGQDRHSLREHAGQGETGKGPSVEGSEESSCFR